MHGVALGRRERSQFLTTCRQVQQRMVLNARCKLVAHLCSHKRMGDMLFLEVFVQRNQVKADFLWNNVDTSSAGQRGIHVHHAGIKAIRSVGSYLMFWFQVVVTLVPVTEAHEVAVFQLAALGHTRRA